MRLGAARLAAGALLAALAACSPAAPPATPSAAPAATQAPPARAASGAPGALQDLAPAAPAPFPGEGELRLVERVVDGDTLVLAGGERVRMLGINALEMKHPDPAVHELAERARTELERAVEGRRVRIVAAGDVPRDKYGRLLAYVEIPGEAEPDVGARLLREGLARPYPSAHPRARAYRLEAWSARFAQAPPRGLWREDVATTLGLEPEAVIGCAEARARLGRRVRLLGAVTAGRRGPGVHVLELRDASGALNLVVFPSRYDEIPLDLVEEWQQAGTVMVDGEVSEHRGRPQVVIEDPFQVRPRPSE